jgi:hypothetical protein
LPGTLSAQVDADAVRVHVLDPAMPWERTLDSLEERVADLFALTGPQP